MIEPIIYAPMKISYETSNAYLRKMLADYAFNDEALQEITLYLRAIERYAKSYPTGECVLIPIPEKEINSI